MPLILTMKPGEEIHIDGPCVIAPACRNAFDKFRVALDAPDSTNIERVKCDPPPRPVKRPQAKKSRS